MRRLMICFVAVIMMFGLVGCSSGKHKTYLSKNSEYTLKYPSNWKYIDDDRKLADVQKEMKIAANIPNAKFKIDASFYKGKEAYGVVMTDSLPTSASKVSEEVQLNFYKQYVKYSGVDLKDIETREINGKKFVMFTTPSTGNIRSMNAFGIMNSKIYMIQFATSSDKWSDWSDMFSNTITSISFRDSDLDSAKKEFKGDKAGFFTGLWHGALIPFRFVGSFIWDIDVYADNNTGNGYMIGFIIGVLFILGGGGSSVKR